MNRRGLAAAILLAAAASAWTGINSDNASAAAGLPQRNPTFAKDIAPLIYARCMPCHRAGQPAPFPLASYDDVRAKAADIVTATRTRRMPPWGATQGPGFPALADDRRLTDRQIAAIATWVAHGMPPGSLRDTPTPPALSSSPWQLGLPDVTITLPRPITLSAGGTDEYRNVVVPMDFPADVAISAIDYLPEPGSVLRHARFFAAPPGLAIADTDPLPGVGGLLGGGSLENYGDRLLAAAGALVDLGAWTPGFARRVTPDGLAIRFPAKSVLVIQMHLHPGEIDAIEDGRVGLYFTKPASRRFVRALAVPPALGIASGLSIPAGDRVFRFADTFVLPIDVDAVGARGDGHLLARDLTMTAIPPARAVFGLLRISDWDANWPEAYYFAAPVHLPKGTVLRSEIVYDNSASNPRNIFSPPRRVVWGRLPSGEIGAMTLLIAEPPAADALVLDAAVAKHLRDQLLRRR
jgi:mono/diheme cytochrome c family protein